MATNREFPESELRRAIAASHSWRGTLRSLGSHSRSSAAIASVRHAADSLGLDYAHFRGQRRWPEATLRDVLERSDTWEEAFRALGCSTDSMRALVEGHARRLRIDTRHLGCFVDQTERASGSMHENLPRAGSLLAASWYALRGCSVSWPLEPCRYDLLVESDSAARRVQVKTTTTRAGTSWKVYLSKSGKGRRVYGPREIDEFFVIDGDGRFYLLPFDAVGGLQAIHLSGYETYRVPDLFD